MTLTDKLGFIPLYVALKILDRAPQDLHPGHAGAPMAEVPEYDTRQLSHQEISEVLLLPKPVLNGLRRKIVEDHLKNPLLNKAVCGTQPLEEVIQRFYERHEQGILASENDLSYVSSLLATNLGNKGMNAYRSIFPVTAAVLGGIGAAGLQLSMLYGTITTLFSAITGLIAYASIHWIEKWDTKHYAHNRIQAAKYITKQVKEVLAENSSDEPSESKTLIAAQEPYAVH